MPKKIVFTVTNDLVYDQRMIRICTSLAKQDFDITLVGRLKKSSAPLDSHPFEQIRLKCIVNKGKIFYLEYNIRLFFFLLTCKADVISAIDLDTLLACTLAARIKGKKLVFDSHEYFTETPEVTDRKTVKKIWEAVAKFCIPKTDARYTVGINLAKIFTEKYEKEFTVIRNLPFYKKVECKNHVERFVLYQGALNEGRCLEQLIDAAEHLPLKVKIAGEGDLSLELQQRSKSKGLEGKVEFLGYLKPHELKEVTSTAWLGYNLLENKGLSYYYSLANKFFDYSMAGIPTLNPPFPEYISIQKQYGNSIICQPTMEAIIDEINSLYHSSSKYSELSEKCFNAAKEFNWENETKKLEKIYARFR